MSTLTLCQYVTVWLAHCSCSCVIATVRRSLFAIRLDGYGHWIDNETEFKFIEKSASTLWFHLRWNELADAFHLHELFKIRCDVMNGTEWEYRTKDEDEWRQIKKPDLRKFVLLFSFIACFISMLRVPGRVSGRRKSIWCFSKLIHSIGAFGGSRSKSNFQKVF